VFTRLTGDPDIPDFPGELLAIMQEPIMTRWWTTTGIAALSFHKYGTVYSALAKAVVNQSTRKMAENMIGSDIVSLATEPVLRNVGTPGFLSYHPSFPILH
jgi:hypothetical protein